ncbi:MAG: hypothetical protein V4850_14610 [Myxococcota bacterium]
MDEIDAEAFRAGVLEAWTDQPLEERRSALAQLLRKITLSPGCMKITYGHCHHEPAGPPWGAWGQWDEAIESMDVRTPRSRA